ncbi:MAG: glycosyl hydrolase family 18 protein [Micrococcus sp.]|nr:glycosyl hydrolase family 18 protein [Micrococcus sp.]
MAGVWVWTGHMWNERIREVLDRFGDRLTDVSLFAWSVNINGDLRETFNPSLLDEYRAKWPHIRFWGCFRNMDDPNDSAFDIWESLRHNSAARARLADQVQSEMFEKYPYLYGVDVDLELGHSGDPDASEQVFREVADRAHALGRKASGALPPLTIDGSIGGEHWVRYRQLGEILDHVSVMSYDFAWGGSSPGPISPGWWLEDVYAWAASQIPPSKLSMGLPCYGRFWRIHDYYPGAYRGVSGTYYAAWQMFTGVTPWDSDHHHVGWLTYRDKGSRTLWGISDCYDWRYPFQYSAAVGVNFGTFNERDYLVRYGRPAGAPIWSVADNSVGTSRAEYVVNAAPVIDNNGREVGPKRGHTLTLEMLQRDPVAATIIDDYANDATQLRNVYEQPDGSWKHEQITDRYTQYRGTGRLRYRHNFEQRALYSQVRFQFATAGRVGVTVHGITADLSNDGQLRLRQGTTILAQTWVTSRPVGAAAQAGRAVIGLRVREGSARVYFGTTETRMPRVLQASVTPEFDGLSDIWATGTAWLDHLYLGDGWLYQPREAVEVAMNGQRKVIGRIPRSGVSWDEYNRFRPLADVDEDETRSETVSQDWVYHHWKDIPITAGRDTLVTLRPVDHDVWTGRLMVVDRDGSSMAYFSDAETLTHWRGRAVHDWGLAGIALWSLGQEDVRFWEILEGGELPPETKRLNV